MEATKTNWREVLKVFCDPEINRFAMQEPWVKDGVMYATDARILAAVAVDEPDTEPHEKRRRPDAAQIISMVSGVESVNAFSDLPPCFHCQSTGYVDVWYRKCPKCGKREEPNDECDKCDGAGELECHQSFEGSFAKPEPCKNSGCRFIPNPESGVGFARHYVLLIQRTMTADARWGLSADGDILVVRDGELTIVLMGKSDPSCY